MLQDQARTVDSRRALLDRFGLGYLGDGPRPVLTESEQVHGERRGLVIAAGDANVARCEELKWQRLEDVTGLEIHRRVWFARTEPDQNPATPESLLRKTTFAGSEVELGDGNRWEIPHALAHESPGARPSLKMPGQWLMKNGKGYLVFSDWQTAHRSLTDAALVLWEIFTMGGGEMVVDWDLAMNAIGVNYRVGPAEISELGLLGKGNVVEIAKVVMDVAGASRVLGKTPPSPPC
jgi:hypothetical protein